MFWKKCQHSTQVWITVVSVILSHKKWCFMKKVADCVLNSIACSFPLRQPLYFSTQQKTFMCIGTSHFITQNIKKMCTQWLRFNELIFFTASSRICQSETAPSVLHSWVPLVSWLLVQYGFQPGFMLRLQLSFPSVLWYHQPKCQHSEKDKSGFSKAKMF